MILVIGYGNPLCGDDGIGPYIVKQLALADAETQSRTDTEYLMLRQLTPELAEPISRAAMVIFVDAADGELPGNIACRELIASTETTSSAFTHHTNAVALLESAHFLYGTRTAAYLYTIAGQNFELGDSFSPAVEAAITLLLDQLKARMAQCMNLASLKQ
jgi:hydrogenase maturation protease